MSENYMLAQCFQLEGCQFLCRACFKSISNAAVPLLSLRIGGMLLVACCLLLVALGVVDDLKYLCVRFRLVVQIFVASLVCFYGDMKTISIGPVLGGADAVLNDVASYLFTVFCTIGVIKPINMTDGLDGFSGSLSLTSFLALEILAHVAGDPNMTALYIVFGCLVSFLAVNNRIFRSNARVFFR